VNLDPLLVEIASRFAVLSLVAFGGVSAALPELRRQVVGAQGWMSDRGFTEAYAISQAAPVPNFLFVSLIGMQIAGIPGALVATVAFVVPSSLVAYGAGRVWDHYHEAPWRYRLELGAAPITVGLVVASALVLARASDETLPAFVVTLATAALLYRTSLNPLFALGAGAVVGALGLV
jgi:chromate transporter